MTTDMSTSIRASRYRVPRTRGAMSGVLLIILGAWAALAPMIGPYFDLAYTPAPNDAWHWTGARGWLEVLPGAAVFLGGLLLLVSASRVVALFGGWLAAAGGAWLVVGPPLADTLNLDLGTPDPTSGTSVQALEALLFFYAVGAAIVLLAGLALGRLSVLSVRDVKAAERRLAAEEAAAETGTTGAYRSEPDSAARHGADETPSSAEGAPPQGDRTAYPPQGDQTAYPPQGGQAGYPQNYGQNSGQNSDAAPTYAHTAPPPPPQENKG